MLAFDEGEKGNDAMCYSLCGTQGIQGEVRTLGLWAGYFQKETHNFYPRLAPMEGTIPQLSDQGLRNLSTKKNGGCSLEDTDQDREAGIESADDC